MKYSRKKCKNKKRRLSRIKSGGGLADIGFGAVNFVSNISTLPFRLPMKIYNSIKNSSNNNNNNNNNSFMNNNNNNNNNYDSFMQNKINENNELIKKLKTFVINDPIITNCIQRLNIIN